MVYISQCLALFNPNTVYPNGLYSIKKYKDEIIYLACCRNNSFFIRKYKGDTPYNEDINGQIEKLCIIELQ